MSRFIGLSLDVDDVADYAVAWAGGMGAAGSSVVSAVSRGFGGAWRAERPKATVRLNRLTSCSSVGVEAPVRQVSRVAGLTPMSWARRGAGVLDSSMAPFMSIKNEGSSITLLTQFVLFVFSCITKPISFSLNQYLGPILRSPFRYALKF